MLNADGEKETFYVHRKFVMDTLISESLDVLNSSNEFLEHPGPYVLKDVKSFFDASRILKPQREKINGAVVEGPANRLTFIIGGRDIYCLDYGNCYMDDPLLREKCSEIFSENSQGASYLEMSKFVMTYLEIGEDVLSEQKLMEAFLGEQFGVLLESRKDALLAQQLINVILGKQSNTSDCPVIPLLLAVTLVAEPHRNPSCFLPTLMLYDLIRNGCQTCAYGPYRFINCLQNIDLAEPDEYKTLHNLFVSYSGMPTVSALEQERRSRETGPSPEIEAALKKIDNALEKTKSLKEEQIEMANLIKGELKSIFCYVGKHYDKKQCEYRTQKLIDQLAIFQARHTEQIKLQPHRLLGGLCFASVITFVGVYYRSRLDKYFLDFLTLVDAGIFFLDIPIDFPWALYCKIRALITHYANQETTAMKINNHLQWGTPLPLLPRLGFAKIIRSLKDMLRLSPNDYVRYKKIQSTIVNDIKKHIKKIEKEYKERKIFLEVQRNENKKKMPGWISGLGPEAEYFYNAPQSGKGRWASEHLMACGGWLPMSSLYSFEELSRKRQKNEETMSDVKSFCIISDWLHMKGYATVLHLHDVQYYECQIFDQSKSAIQGFFRYIEENIVGYLGGNLTTSGTIRMTEELSAQVRLECEWVVKNLGGNRLQKYTYGTEDFNRALDAEKEIKKLMKNIRFNTNKIRVAPFFALGFLGVAVAAVELVSLGTVVSVVTALAGLGCAAYAGINYIIYGTHDENKLKSIEKILKDNPRNCVLRHEILWSAKTKYDRSQYFGKEIVESMAMKANEEWLTKRSDDDLIDPRLLADISENDHLFTQSVFQNGLNLEHVPTRLHSNSLYEHALRENGMALQFIGKDFRYPGLCILAVRQNPDAISFVPNVNRSFLTLANAASQSDEQEYIPLGVDTENDLTEEINDDSPKSVSGVASFSIQESLTANELPVVSAEQAALQNDVQYSQYGFFGERGGTVFSQNGHQTSSIEQREMSL